MVAAVFEMFASLSTGTLSTTACYELMSASENKMCSWQSLFGALEFYGTSVRQNQGSIPEEELTLLLGFLNLATRVVKHSELARTAMLSHNSFRPVAVLASILSTSVPIELKSCVLNCLSEFCATEDSAHDIWSMIEQAQVFKIVTYSSRSTDRDSDSVQRRNLFLTQIEETDFTNGTYENMISLTRFIASIIGPSSCSSRGTLPRKLMQAPSPILNALVDYIIEEGLLKAKSREFRTPSDRWSLTAACLDILVRSLENFDSTDTFPPDSYSAQLTDRHIAIRLLTRILTASPVLHELFSVIMIGCDSLNDNMSKLPSLTQSIHSTLKILNLVMKHQSCYLRTMRPERIEGEGRGNSKAGMDLGQLLLFSHEVVVQIALYVNADDASIVSESLAFMRCLSNSVQFEAVDRFGDRSGRKINRLLGIIRASEETSRIKEGFISLLQSEEDADSGDTLGSPNQAPRSQVMRILIENTATGKIEPNLAHFILGYQQSPSTDTLCIEDLSAPNARIGGIHVIMEQLDLSCSQPLRHTLFVKSGLKLLSQLCYTDHTSSVTLRHIRTSDQFLSRQIQRNSIISQLTQALHKSTDSHLGNYSEELVNLSHGLASLLSIASLEIHLASSESRQSSCQELLQSLIIMTDEVDSDIQSGRAHTKLADYLTLLSLPWPDQCVSNFDISKSLFANLDYTACLVRDQDDCAVYDDLMVSRCIKHYLKVLEQQGLLQSTAQREIHRQETLALKQHLALTNIKNRLQHARSSILESWIRLANVILERIHSSQDNVVSITVSITRVITRFMHDHADMKANDDLSALLVLACSTLGIHIASRTSENAITKLLEPQLRDWARLYIAAGSTVVERNNLLTCFLQMFTRRNLDHPEPKSDVRNQPQETPLYIIKSAVSAHIERVVEVACRDALGAPAVWRTVSYGFLEMLVSIMPDIAVAISRTGYLKSMVQTLKDSEQELGDALGHNPGELCLRPL